MAIIYKAILLFFMMQGVSAASIPTVEQAFVPTLAWEHATQLRFRVAIHPSAYLYRHSLKWDLHHASSTHAASPIPLQKIALPAGVVIQDKGDAQIAVYVQSVEIPVRLTEPLHMPATLSIQLQGCSKAFHVCYSPQTFHYRLQPNSGGIVPASTDASRPAATPFWPKALQEWVWTLLSFFGAGLLLAATACMYPLIPIMSAMIVGAVDSRARAFWLSVLYVQGFALTYTFAGVVAAVTGLQLSAWVQSRWLIGATAVGMGVLALSMFGVFSLQLPRAWQDGLARFSDARGRLGGRAFSIWSAGALSALFVGPCVTPGLAAALLYIARTGDLWLGGASLYAMALGIGVPLLIVGALGQRILPRAGAWLLWSRKIAGGLLLVAAAWIAWPLLSRVPAQTMVPFQTIDSVSALDRVLANANHQPVLLDFYANWCRDCVKMDETTWRDPKVHAQLKEMRLLRVDLSESRASHRALLARFKLPGPPLIVVFDRDATVAPHLLVGFISADALLMHLKKQGIAQNPTQYAAESMQPK